MPEGKSGPDQETTRLGVEARAGPKIHGKIFSGEKDEPAHGVMLHTWRCSTYRVKCIPLSKGFKFRIYLKHVGYPGSPIRRVKRGCRLKRGLLR